KASSRYSGASSVLLTHRHAPGTGVDPSADQLQQISRWLMNEAQCKSAPPPTAGSTGNPGGNPGSAGSGGSTGNPPPTMTRPMTSDAALALFAQCMDFGEFQQDDVQSVANQGTTGGRCTSCHGQGAGDEWLSNDGQAMFNAWRMEPYIEKFALPRRNGDGTY